MDGRRRFDRPTVRLFSDQAKAETERDFHVQQGRQAYLLPPAAASGGTPTTADGAFTHVRDQLKALYAGVGLLAVEKDLKRSTPAWLMRPASSRTSRSLRQGSPRTRTQAMLKTEVDLLELMRADRQVQNKRQADQAAVDLEATGESVGARSPEATQDCC
jgi:hypothetical protein